VARKDEFLTEAYEKRDHGSTEYFTGAGGNAVGTQSGGQVSVSNPSDYYQHNNDYDDEDKYNNEQPGTTWMHATTNKAGDQIPLFGVRHKPPVINYMMSTKDATNETMTLAAHAAEEARLRFGERPWASESLSEHSAPLANEGIKSGIIKGIIGRNAGELYDIDDEGTNGINWVDSHRNVQDAAAAVQRALDSDGTVNPYYADSVQKLDPKIMKMHKGTLVKEALHNKRAKALGKDPNSITPDEINYLKGQQWLNDQPELPFDGGSWINAKS
jgi:hypothetical protein